MTSKLEWRPTLVPFMRLLLVFAVSLSANAQAMETTAMSDEMATRYAQAVAVAEKVAPIAASFARDFCGVYAFRVKNGLPAIPWNPLDFQRDQWLLLKELSTNSELRASLAAHLLVQKNGLRNILNLSPMVTEGESYDALYLPSGFTQALVETPQFQNGFERSACNGIFTFERFKELVAYNDLGPRIYVELFAAATVVTRGVSLLGAAASATRWGKPVVQTIRQFLTPKKVAIATGTLSVVAITMTGLDLNRLWAARKLTDVGGRKMSSSEHQRQTIKSALENDSDDYVSIRTDELYTAVQDYVETSQASEERRRVLASTIRAFLQEEDQTPLRDKIRRSKLAIDSAIQSGGDLAPQLGRIKAKSIAGTSLTPSELELVAAVSFIAQLDLLISFSKN